MKRKKTITILCIGATALLTAAVLLFLRFNVKPDRTIYYFYEEVCASCDQEGPFYELLRQKTAGVSLPEKRSILCRNVFTNGEEAFQALCDERGIAPEKRKLPMLITAAGYAAGEQEISDNLRQLVCRNFNISDTQTLWYYYRPDCKDCIRIAPMLDPAFAAYPNLTLIRIDTTDQGPKAAFKQSLADWKVPSNLWQVPFLYNGEEYLSGDQAIEDGLEAFLEQSAQQTATNP